MVSHLNVNMIRRRAFGLRPTFVENLDQFLGNVDAPFVSPAVIKPLSELLGGIVVEHVDVEFTLFGESGEREIAGTKKSCDGIVRVRPETKVEFGMERVPE